MWFTRVDMTAGLWAGQFRSPCTDEDTGVSRSRNGWAEATGQLAGRPTGSLRPDLTDSSSVLRCGGACLEVQP